MQKFRARRGGVPLGNGAPHNPFVVVLAGETYMQAIGRHRRQTGHRGACIIAWEHPDASPFGA
jgi:hypothetical protein